MRITEHFTFEELVASDYATSHGINNQPVDHEVMSNIHALAEGLERVRNLFNLPIHISSGYRSPKVNSGVGGSKNSAHMRGLAADIVIPGIDPRDVCKKIMLAPEVGFAQLIWEVTWTHIAFPEMEEIPKREVLTAIFKPGQPTTYVKGIA